MKNHVTVPTDLLDKNKMLKEAMLSAAIAAVEADCKAKGIQFQTSWIHSYTHIHNADGTLKSIQVNWEAPASK